MQFAIDVTESGSVDYYTYLPNWQKIHHPKGIWKYFGYTHAFTVNTLQIVRFKSIEVPIVNVHRKRKSSVGWFKALLLDGWGDDKIYDIDIKNIGIKKVTMLQLATGETYYVNEPAEIFRNAINSIANQKNIIA